LSIHIYKLTYNYVNIKIYIDIKIDYWIIDDINYRQVNRCKEVKGLMAIIIKIYI